MKIRATVYAITDIDNVKQEFTANLAVRARWKEPLFQGRFVNEAEIRKIVICIYCRYKFTHIMTGYEIKSLF